MNEYTPTTENIRQTFAYVQAGLDDDDGYPFVMHVHVEEFDRWLAAEKAAVWDEACARLHRGIGLADPWAAVILYHSNPYREVSDASS